MSPTRVRVTGDLFHPVIPDGAVAVIRPRRFSNPHPVGKSCKRCAGSVHDVTQSVSLFTSDLLGGRLSFTLDDVAREVAGRDLACWCAPEATCHADILLAVANGGAA